MVDIRLLTMLLFFLLVVGYFYCSIYSYFYVLQVISSILRAKNFFTPVKPTNTTRYKYLMVLWQK